MKKKLTVLLFVCALGMMMSCSDKDKKDEVADVKGSESVAKDIVPMERFEETVTLTAVLDVSTPDSGIDTDVEPETNYWLELLKEELNIEVEYLWAVPVEQYNQKMAIAMTSDDLPDILTDLNLVQYAMLQKNDRLADLSDSLYIGLPELQELWYRIPEIQEMFIIDGEQFVLPSYWDPRRSTTVMYVRQDWLDAVGMDMPETIDDLRAVSEAFVNQDPDGNGIDDTYGLQLARDNAAHYIDRQSVANYLQSFGAYPGAWLLADDGTLIPGMIQPEIREGLLWMSEMYADGLIDPEFVVKDASKNKEEVIANKFGIGYGPWWYASTNPFQGMLKDTSVDWKPAQIVGVDGPGKTATPRVVASTVSGIHIDAADKVPAYIQMLNFAYALGQTVYEDVDGNFLTGDFRTEIDQDTLETRSVWQWIPVSFGLDPFDIEKEFSDTNAAWDAQDTSLLPTAKSIAHYKAFQDYEEYLETGEMELLEGLGGWWARARPGGSWDVTRDVFAADGYVYDEKFGVATPTEQSRGASLEAMAAEVFLKIVMGDAPIEDFDEFVENWKKLGGDDLIIEVNEAYQAL